MGEPVEIVKECVEVLLERARVDSLWIRDECTKQALESMEAQRRCAQELVVIQEKHELCRVKIADALRQEAIAKLDLENVVRNRADRLDQHQERDELQEQLEVSHHKNRALERKNAACDDRIHHLEALVKEKNAALAQERSNIPMLEGENVSTVNKTDQHTIIPMLETRVHDIDHQIEQINEMLDLTQSTLEKYRCDVVEYQHENRILVDIVTEKQETIVRLRNEMSTNHPRNLA